MAYDEDLANRVRAVLADRPGMSEKRMFGGLAFLLNGNMACGVQGNELMVRLAADESDGALEEPGTRPFDMTGRPMKGWILVGSAGHTDRGLDRWVERGVEYASSLPPK